jgi:ribosomal protein L3
MIGIIGKKMRNDTSFSDDGQSVPVTIIKRTPIESIGLNHQRLMAIKQFK